MQRTLIINDQTISYKIVGDGSPVLLVHGFGEDGRVWEKQEAVLQENFLLIIPDLPGSGKSGATDDLGMEGMARVLKAVLDQEKIESCIMVGHSMGGYVTLAFAEHYPQHLKAFGLFHSTAYADNDEKKTARKRGIDFILENGPEKFLEQSTRKLFSEEFSKENPAVVEEFIDRFTNFPAQSLVSYYEAMMQRPDRTQVLKEFKGPVLFIIGQYDTAILPDQVLEQVPLPRLAYIQLLMHSGHMGMIEEAETSTAFLDKFLRDSAMS